MRQGCNTSGERSSAEARRDFWNDVITTERAHLVGIKRLLYDAPDREAQRLLLAAVQASAELMRHAGREGGA